MDTNNTDPVRAQLAPKLDMIISGYRINQDDADWLRGLLHRAAAPPSAPVGVEKVKKALERLDLTIEACTKLTLLLGDGQPHSDLISTASGQAALAKEAIQRALTQQPAAPSGEAVGDWVLVPRKPTLAMANAAWRDLESQGIDPEDVETPQVWDAMLAAAPQQPAGVDEAMVEGLKQLVRHLAGNPNFDFDAALADLAAQQQG